MLWRRSCSALCLVDVGMVGYVLEAYGWEGIIIGIIMGCESSSGM